MKKIINTLRWIGAVVLPVPISWLVSIINKWLAYRYIDVPNCWWYLVFDSGLQGVVESLCIYKIVPSAKFYSASIIATMFATISLVIIVIWCIKYPFDIWKFIQYIAHPIGMVLGLVSIYKDEHK